jgi:zinc transporter ZupT
LLLTQAKFQQEITPMDVARKLGILVFCAVPAIVGGGIVYYAFGSLTAVAIYQVILIVGAGAFVSR